MKITRLLCFLLLMATSLTAAKADILPQEAAARRAMNYLSGRGALRLPAAPDATLLTYVATLGQSDTQPSCYVFSCPEDGYIFAAADDRQPAVLGIVSTGDFDADNLPPALRQWLGEVRDLRAAPRAAEKAEIAPLLDEIVWTQDAPFNNLCPRYRYQSYDYPTYAGCAAIAVAQIMRYHKYPAQGTGTVAYTTSTYGIDVSDDLGAHTYDWAHILPNYIYQDYGAEEATAVATLVYDVAAAMQTDFTPASSSTQDFRAAQALKYNFGYDKSLRLEDHGNYSCEAWADMLYDELAAGRPVYLSGCNAGGGHAFVVDGYRGDGLFHINWGWNGTANGEYLLTDLTPRSQGIGGNGGGYAFMQNAIVGIRPDEGGAETPAILALHYEQIWAQTDEEGDAIYAEVTNPTATDFDGYMALRVRDGETLVVDPMNAALKTTCKAGYSGTRAWSIDLGGGLNKVGLIFDIVYRVEGDEQWHRAEGRDGSPCCLVSYRDTDGFLRVGIPTDSVYQMRLATLAPEGTLTPSGRGKFTATIKGDPNREYFAPLYLFIYDAKGENLLQYSDYKLCLVPKGEDATFTFDCALPAAGTYLCAVAYEYLGYYYDYTPMPLGDGSGSYGIKVQIGEAGEGGEMQISLADDPLTNASDAMYCDDTLTLEAPIYNAGDAGEVTLTVQIVNPNRLSEIFLAADAVKAHIDADDTYTLRADFDLSLLAPRDYDLLIRYQTSTMVLPRTLTYIPFTVTSVSGVNGLTTTAERATRYDLWGRRIGSMQHGISLDGTRKILNQ